MYSWARDRVQWADDPVGTMLKDVLAGKITKHKREHRRTRSYHQHLKFTIKKS